MAGVQMMVSVEVSVATMEKASAHHGAVRPPRKYSRPTAVVSPVAAVRWTRRKRTPSAVTPSRYATTMARSSGWMRIDGRLYAVRAASRTDFFTQLRKDFQIGSDQMEVELWAAPSVSSAVTMRECCAWGPALPAPENVRS